MSTRVERRQEKGGKREEDGEREGGWKEKWKKVNKTVSFIIYTCTCIYVHVHVEKVVLCNFLTSFRMCFSRSRRGRALRFGLSPTHTGLNREAFG